MILIAYDGSDDAKAAIEHAASLMAGQPAIVATVWDPYGEIVARTPALAFAAGPVHVPELDEENCTRAEDTAEEGSALARAHGIAATPRVVARGDSVADTILAAADRANAGAIVVGSRGLGGLGSLLLGSVSHAVLQHADRPVVIVPSPKVARRRNEKRRALDESAV